MKIIIPILFSVFIFSCSTDLKNEEYYGYIGQHIHNEKYLVRPTQCGYFLIYNENDGILKRYYSGYYEKPFDAHRRGYFAIVDTFYFKYDSLRYDEQIDSCFQQPILNTKIHEALERYNYEFIKFENCNWYSNEFLIKHKITQKTAKSHIDTWSNFYTDSATLIRYLELDFPNEEILFRFKLRDAIRNAANQ